MNTDATAAEPAETAVVAGVSCTRYTRSASVYEYEYWTDVTTGLVFEYRCTYEGGATETLITVYDTDVASFGDIDLPA